MMDGVQNFKYIFWNSDQNSSPRLVVAMSDCHMTHFSNHHIWNNMITNQQTHKRLELTCCFYKYSQSDWERHLQAKSQEISLE